MQQEKHGANIVIWTFIMVFFSGFAGLVYQVLWMRQIGLLLGNTSHASAITLGTFFAGLAIGSFVWGNKSSITKNPLKVYGLLEVGIAVTALFYFLVLWYGFFTRVHKRPRKTNYGQEWQKKQRIKLAPPYPR